MDRTLGKWFGWGPVVLACGWGVQAEVELSRYRRVSWFFQQRWLVLINKTLLVSKSGLLSSLGVREELETIRLPLKGSQVKQPIRIWAKSKEVHALCPELSVQCPDVWNLVSLGIP